LRELTRVLGRPTQVRVAEATAHALRVRTWLVSTEGTHIAQETVHVGGCISTTAEVDGEFQVRTYPKHYDGNVVSGGWEAFEALDLMGHCERVSQEAVALCTAPTCPEIKGATVILEGGILSLQVHESCGHPTELDRAFGEEVSLAGASFLTPNRLNETFRYGSDIVTLYADATSSSGCGTFGWDDEGTPAHRTDLVKDGLFVGYLSGREAANRVERPSAGSLRAEGWYNIPIVRMININLAPGSWTFDDLIADTDDGILLSNSKSWSIDDLRLNFQFGCELAQEIKGGKLGQIYRNPVYTGITPRFWQSCDAICNQDHWKMWGYLHCGKGDPMQTMHVGHGVAPARFRGGVDVGST
jgi:TldD protein